MSSNKDARIRLVKDGPYMVIGNVPLIREAAVREGDRPPTKWRKVAEYPLKERYALCRCGQTKSSPYCDGSHAATKFDGTETAVRRTRREKPRLIKGPGVDMDPNAAPCARAQFCQREGGIGRLIADSGNKEKRDLAIEIAGQCPAGRLVIYDKIEGAPIEREIERSISVTEDPSRKISGPLWVKGGIVIEGADGEPYLTANSAALCRCGRSKRMPFCDGTHVEVGFNRTDDLK